MTEAPVVPPLCLVCAHLHTGTAACDAFPEGIPELFLAGERHIDLIPCDQGIAFRKSDGEPSYFITQAIPETLFRVTCAGSYERYVPIMERWELDNDFIRYLLAAPVAFRPVDTPEAEAFMDRVQECLDAMNPCMREVRRMMYLCSGKHEWP